MSSSINIVAVISPKADKVDQVTALFQNQAKLTEANEPGCLKYHLHKRTTTEGVPDLVLIERYVNQQALENHLRAPYFMELYKTIQEEDLLSRQMTMEEVFVAPIGGFETRA